VNVLRQEKKIADLIKRHMQSHHLTTVMFAKQSNLSSLSLQSILFGRLPNMIELDHLTTAMGMQTGDLYVLYEIQLRKLKFAWPKTFRYLIHCAKKSLHEHLISGVKHCYTMKNASVRLLHLAEYLYSIGIFSAAEIIYNLLLKANADEEDTFLAMSRENISLCQFRIFQQACNTQFGHAPSALRFIPFRNSLPTKYALEGLLLLSQNFIAQERYESAESYANELTNIAYHVNKKKRSFWMYPSIKTIRPLITYYGNSLLIKGICYEMRGMYNEAKQSITKYGDLSWFASRDQEEALAVQRFKVIAEGKMMCLNIKSGDWTEIEKYIDFLKNYPEQIIDGLITLLSSANEQQYCIDDMLKEFTKQIETFNNEIIYYSIQKEPLQCQQYVQFHYHYAIYCFERGKEEQGIEHTLTSLQYARGMKNNRIFINSMSLFEKYRSYATTQQQHCYEELCQNILNETNEESSFSYNFFWQMMMSV
jgi:hypothetical protein